MNDSPEAPAQPVNLPRRNFFRKAMAVIFGAMALLIPGGAGLAVLLDPLRRKSSKATFLRITTLDSLPADGAPRRFPVRAERIDAWNREVTQVGAVYLQRRDDKVIAFNARCPHLGCSVDLVEGGFGCPCHASRFNTDGSIVAGSVTPRALDELEVNPEALKSGLVEVRFQNFVTATKEKIAKS